MLYLFKTKTVVFIVVLNITKQWDCWRDKHIWQVVEIDESLVLKNRVAKRDHIKAYPSSLIIVALQGKELESFDWLIEYGFTSYRQYFDHLM